MILAEVYLVCVWLKIKSQFILLFTLFLVLFIKLTVLFSTIHGLTILFELTFVFIYSTFSKKFSVSTK